MPGIRQPIEQSDSCSSISLRQDNHKHDLHCLPEATARDWRIFQKSSSAREQSHFHPNEKIDISLFSVYLLSIEKYIEFPSVPLLDRRY